MLAIFELFWTKAMSLYTNWGCYQTLPLVPSVPFFIIVIKFDIKIVRNMKIGCGSWGPPFCRHLPTNTIGIILTLQNFRAKNNIIDICYKSLRKWKFHWWVDFRIYDGVPPFLEWIWRNPVFLSIGGEFMMSAYHMMGFQHMMCIVHSS